ncbi:MAG: LCP family protein [Ardenticatenaceae bacterium]|nr:LCP family protein [Ardenticatenaceae bacterium]
MKRTKNVNRTKRWLGRLGGALTLAFLIIGGLFWLNLSANESEVVLPTFAAQAAAPPAQETTPSPEDESTEINAIKSTFTPIPTITNTPPPGATATPEATPTPIASPTPTSVPQPTVGLETYKPTEPTPFPAATPVESIDLPNGVTNILLIGGDAISDKDQPGTERTDSIVIVSINRELGTASMLSVPRDLYLYIPGWIESRINTAYAHGNAVKYPGGGVKLLKDTILYNFGIPIHYYAKVDFAGFEQIVDAIGGIEIINSCNLRDWQLKEPGLDINIEENWVMVTLEPGVHEMGGFEALWYARSRRTTSDFDRGRRQQQVLQAIFNKAVDLDLLTQLPTLWAAYQDTVETDMDMGKMLQLAAVAPLVRENGIQHLYLTQGEIEYRTLEGGTEVLGLNPTIAPKTFEQLYQVPDLNRSARQPLTIEIINRSGRPDVGYIAADTANWFGFDATVIQFEGPTAATTTIDYHKASLKGSYDWLVSWVFGVNQGAIEVDPDSEAAYLYQVTLGEDYRTCRNPLYAPRP